jgi:hypothetical protein
MTEDQAKRLSGILQDAEGLEMQQGFLVKQAGIVRKAQADWWAETIKALGIPEEYAQRLSANTKTGKILLMAPAPTTPTPFPTVGALTRLRP